MFGKANCVNNPVSNGVSFVSEPLEIPGIWSERADYDGEYPYEQSVRVVQMSEENRNSFQNCMVTFDEKMALSGIFSPVCKLGRESGSTGGFWTVTLYAKEAVLGGGYFVVTFIA